MRISFKRLRSACKNLNALREVAKHVATLTSSKALDNDRIVLPPGYHPFIVPLPAKNYKIEFFIGEMGCELIARIRKNDLNLDEAFAVTFLDYVGPPLKVNVASERLGVHVYHSPMFSEQEITDRLLTPKLGGLLGKLNFSTISKFVFSPLQMEIRSSATDAAACAEIAGLGRDLILTAYEETQQRSQNKG